MGAMSETQVEAHVGRTIRRWRVKRGWSQKELSEELGIHQTAVGKMENAAQRIDFGTVVRIAEVLDIPWDSLRPEKSDNRQKVLDGLRELSEALDSWRQTRAMMRSILKDVSTIRKKIEDAAEGDEEIIKVARDIEDGMSSLTPEISLSELAWPRIGLDAAEERIRREILGEPAIS